MNINRKKITSSKKSEIEQSPIVFDITMLDCFCKYILTDSRWVRKHHLMNIRALIEIIDPSTYENDIEKVKRYRFLKRGIELRLDKHIDNPLIMLEEISTRLGEDISFIDPNNYQLSSNEMAWVNETVTETLSYVFIFNHVDKIMDACTRFKTTDYRYRGAIVDEFEVIADELKNSFRRNRVDNMQDMTFTLRDGQFEQVIQDTYNIVTSPSRRLLCMMQGLNQLVGGGFENQRVYMLYGMTAVGKSMVLINLLYQLKRANKNYKTKDPTKTPCIVLLTMENSVIETITRLFAIIADGDKMNNYTVDEVIRKLREDGELVLNDDSPIDIVIKYKANRSVDTSWLYTMTSDLEDDGYEVICLIQDHIKRIRSVFKTTDYRLELGEVVNEFKSYAIAQDIPVISVGHLNREAAKIIENITQSKKNVDATKKLGKSTVGESFLMLDNLDWAANINIDYDENHVRYMAFDVTKQRDDAERTYIAQPFVEGSKIRLMEDLYLPVPVFKETLHESSLYQGEESRRNIRRNSYADISALDSMFKKEDNNIFEVPTKYTNMTPIENVDDDDIYNITPITVGKPSEPAIPIKPKKSAISFFEMAQKPNIIPLNIKQEAIGFF